MKKNIAFIFPYNTWGGAFRSTYSLGSCLLKRGYNIDIIFPIIPPRNGYKKFSFKWFYIKIRGIVRSLLRGKKIRVDTDLNIIMIPWISSLWIKNYDYIIANHWNTVEDIYHLPERCGEKWHYIRDIEQWSFYFEQELKGFKLPIKKIVVANWIKDFLLKEYNISVNAVITNGTEVSRFEIIKDKPPLKNICIGMCCSDHPMKGIEYGLEAMRKVSLVKKDLKFILFGYKKPSNLNFKCEWIQAPMGENLREVYRRIHIFISPSIQEGFHNPPREAMSARCALIATNVGCIPDFGQDCENMLIVKKRSSKDIEEAIKKIIDDKSLMKKIVRNAFNTIKKQNWESRANQFERTLSIRD